MSIRLVPTFFGIGFGVDKYRVREDIGRVRTAYAVRVYLGPLVWSWEVCRA